MTSESQLTTPKLHTAIKIIGGTILYTSALYVTFDCIVFLINIYQVSTIAGIIMTFGFGPITWGPAIIAWGGPHYLLELLEEIQNKWEYTTKIILGFVGLIVLPNILLMVIKLIFVYIVNRVINGLVQLSP